ncbi:MAG: hypothetical protein ACOYBF_05855 [Bilifractor porci]
MANPMIRGFRRTLSQPSPAPIAAPISPQMIQNFQQNIDDDNCDNHVPGNLCVLVVKIFLQPLISAPLGFLFRFRLLFSPFFLLLLFFSAFLCGSSLLFPELLLLVQLFLYFFFAGYFSLPLFFLTNLFRILYKHGVSLIESMRGRVYP